MKRNGNLGVLFYKFNAYGSLMGAGVGWELVSGALDE
jgi:hypothetical protein